MTKLEPLREGLGPVEYSPMINLVGHEDAGLLHCEADGCLSKGFPREDRSPSELRHSGHLRRYVATNFKSLEQPFPTDVGEPSTREST